MSEFHSGYRIYSTRALADVPFALNSDDFHFDTGKIIQFLFAGKKIIELPIPTYYGDEICRVNGLAYAFRVLGASISACIQKYWVFYNSKFDCLSGAKKKSKY